jgi:GNAT superfamily N-acetyltransferase
MKNYFQYLEIQDTTNLGLINEICALHRELLPDALFATFNLKLGTDIYRMLIADRNVKVVGAFESTSNQLVGAGIFLFPKFSILQKTKGEFSLFFIQASYWLLRNPVKVLGSLYEYLRMHYSRPKGPAIEISAIFVLSEYQRHGVSTNILKFAETLTSLKPFFVSTKRDNTKAIAFYQKTGFVFASEGKNDVWLKK